MYKTFKARSYYNRKNLIGIFVLIFFISTLIYITSFITTTFNQYKNITSILSTKNTNINISVKESNNPQYLLYLLKDEDNVINSYISYYKNIYTIYRSKLINLNITNDSKIFKNINDKSDGITIDRITAKKYNLTLNQYIYLPINNGGYYKINNISDTYPPSINNNTPGYIYIPFNFPDNTLNLTLNKSDANSIRKMNAIIEYQSYIHHIEYKSIDSWINRDNDALINNDFIDLISKCVSSFKVILIFISFYLIYNLFSLRMIYEKRYMYINNLLAISTSKIIFKNIISLLCVSIIIGLASIQISAFLAEQLMNLLNNNTIFNIQNIRYSITSKDIIYNTSIILLISTIPNLIPYIHIKGYLNRYTVKLLKYMKLITIRISSGVILGILGILFSFTLNPKLLFTSILFCTLAFMLLSSYIILPFIYLYSYILKISSKRYKASILLIKNNLLNSKIKMHSSSIISILFLSSIITYAVGIPSFSESFKGILKDKLPSEYSIQMKHYSSLPYVLNQIKYIDNNPSIESSLKYKDYHLLAYSNMNTMYKLHNTIPKNIYPYQNNIICTCKKNTYVEIYNKTYHVIYSMKEESNDKIVIIDNETYKKDLYYNTNSIKIYLDNKNKVNTRNIYGIFMELYNNNSINSLLITDSLVEVFNTNLNVIKGMILIINLLLLTVSLLIVVISTMISITNKNNDIKIMNQLNLDRGKIVSTLIHEWIFQNIYIFILGSIIGIYLIRTYMLAIFKKENIFIVSYVDLILGLIYYLIVILVCTIYIIYYINYRIKSQKYMNTI